MERPEERQQGQPLHRLDRAREALAEHVRQQGGAERQCDSGHETVDGAAENKRPGVRDRRSESGGAVPEEPGIGRGQ